MIKSNTQMDLGRICSQRKKYPVKKEEDFESLEFYLNLSTITIRRYAPALASILLKNEDAISNIAYHLMMADWRWDGRGNKKFYRQWCGYLAIQLLISKHKKNSKVFQFSIDTESIPNNELPANEVKTTWRDRNAKTPYQILALKEDKEYLQYLISGLTKRQQQCLTMHYMDNMSFANIGRELGISRVAVFQHVQSGIYNLKYLIQ